MEIRVNKMISDAGICSRREADRYIEEGRVTVNGRISYPGQIVTEKDVVLLDDIQVKIRKSTIKKAPPVISGIPTLNLRTTSKTVSGRKKTATEKRGAEVEEKTNETKRSKGLRPGKYVKYNKYAAARHAAREKAEGDPKKKKIGTLEDVFGEEQVKKAMQPKFGKSLKRSAVAQRLAMSPKSAALRKTSRNNPINKAKRAERNQRKEE